MCTVPNVSLYMQAGAVTIKIGISRSLQSREKNENLYKRFTFGEGLLLSMSAFRTLHEFNFLDIGILNVQARVISNEKHFFRRQ